jgi:hypothetical protein
VLNCNSYKMRKISIQLLTSIFLMIGLTFGNELNAQTKNGYVQIINKFEQWKLTQFKSENYASDKECNPDTVTKEGYKGPEMGIPKDIDISFTDINNDNIIDGLVTFNPNQCDGGNALMNAQIRVLLLSNGTSYIIDDTYIDGIENRFKKGWLSIESATDGTFYGTYFEYKDTDGRCCPGIRRPFTIDYKTKKLIFSDGK